MAKVTDQQAPSGSKSFSKSNIFSALIVAALIFFYGVGVGRYELPPFKLMKSIAGWSGPEAEFSSSVAVLEGGPVVSNKPRVLIIGDSISIGYTPTVSQLLSHRFAVSRVLENGGSTKKVLENLGSWLGAEKWEIIYFNAGLHDLSFLTEDGRKFAIPGEGVQQVPLEQYGANLREIVKRLKATGARLIFATTTPVPAGAEGRRADENHLYNRLARQVMESEGVAISDLEQFIEPMTDAIQLPKNVHFTPLGYEVLGAKVAEAIIQSGEKR